MTEQRQQTTFEISDRVNIGSPSPVPVAQLIEETDVWKYLSCMGVDRHMIHSLLINCMYTDDWSLDKLKQNVWQEYLFWHCVIAVVEDSVELSFKENMPIILENLNYSSVNVSVFLRKIRNKMKSVFKKKDLSIGKEQAIGIAFKDVGPLCEKEGISLDWLKNPSPIPNKINVTNGLIVELRKVRMQHSILHKTVALWVQFLCHLNYTPDSDGLKRNIELVYKKLSKISLHNRQNVSAYLTEQYIPPQKRNTLCNNFDSNEKRISSEKVDNKRFQDYINNASQKFGEQKKIIIDLEKKLEKTRQQKFSANLKLFKIRKEYKKVTAKYTDSLSKMSELSTRNVNKRLKRKQTHISQLTSEKNKHEKEMKYLRQRNKNIKRKYKGQSALLRYYRNKNLKKENSNETVDSIKKSGIRMDSDMVNRMKYLENENEILKENIENLMQSQIVQTFHGGKYNDTIREVYASLLSMNVGVCNVEKIVRTVLEKMGGLKVDRLPKKTFAETMLIEAKIIAQLQATEAMLSSNNNTLHTDGTKRDGREFGGLQIGTDSGQYSIGLVEMLRGDTENFLQIIDLVITDMAKLLQENYTEKKKELLLSIKNIMTDRHIVNTCLKTSLEKIKLECIPDSSDNSEQIRKKISKLNGFKCNLHILVNLASQAESGLKLWEQSVLESESFHQFTYNQNTSDFIRASTKLCVPGADEKSGYGQLFLTFLKQLDIPVDLKMSTFHGHRINLLFSMGAAVFFHREHIKEFIDSFFSITERNSLITSVYHYVDNPVYLAGCRAFGIVDKILTGPIWRIIESTSHILDLNKVWFDFKKILEKYSVDATELVEGKVLYPEYTVQDKVFESLFLIDNEELNILTTEALQIVLLNFCIIIERQLFDNLPGGILNEETEGVNGKELRDESTTVKPTNIVSERDFANLDRLKREKPNANIIALEGLILFTNNKTLHWLDQMETEKKTQIFKIARERAPAMLKQFKLRKEHIKNQHILLLKNKREEKLRKENSKQQELQSLTKDIEKIGGLWVTSQDINKNIKKLNETEKMEAVKLQLKFRKKVLKCNPEDKFLLQFSANGIQFPLHELVSHLKVVLAADYTQTVPSNSIVSFVIKSKNERDEIMQKQREIVLKKIENIKLKKCTEANKVFKEPVPKRKKTVSVVENASLNTVENNSESDIIMNVENSSQSFDHDMIITGLNECPVGKNVVVAYMDTWYPGQVIAQENNIFKVKFLHPAKAVQNLFKWPEKEDISEIDEMFIFYLDFEILSKDSGGRTWYLTNYHKIQYEYEQYCRKYFD